MILVLAGTQDGRELAAQIAGCGLPVIVSVVSDYGRSLAELGKMQVNTGQLSAYELAEFIGQRDIKLVIDASHPYAVNASRNAMQASLATGIQYIRFEREKTHLPAYERLIVVPDAKAAAEAAAGCGRVIFLTIGSRSLITFKNTPALREHRLVARVLPQPNVLSECLEMGFSPKDIIAMQGPFSYELNVALFTEYNANVIVTKNSGEIGGTDAKFTAAIALGLTLVVIDRPVIEYTCIFRTVEEILSYCLNGSAWR
ncbi:MAG TPA: precorrin-6A reductase [Methylomusa anaerophila]|uniref:Precorrin-6A reductase n=1 Tax=Methylomusa anaerophila TaxID=1930071 RepID=A0A348AQE1_9FIRM|nr:precorrin-6A reductase [Methylomusa anaerophila]BBB93289.1 precorrin-6A reductase [Methylomusa anaerophila]HML86880.1 precorrin-6A reductase [Methylomusa anaerophila]